MEQLEFLADVEVVGDSTVRVTFRDGAAGDLDLRGQANGVLGEALRDPTYFALARLDADSDMIVWPNGAHVHGEELREMFGRKGANA